jgi:predicted ester cyclase
MIYRKQVIVYCVLAALLLSIFPASITAQETPAATQKAVIQQVYDEAFNTGNLAVIDANYAPEYVNHGFGDDLTLADFKATIEAMRSAMPDFAATIEVLIAEEGWAASRLRYSGTFENEWVFMGETLAPTSEKVEWTLNIIHRFDENGQIAEDFTAFDRLDLPLPADTIMPDYVEGQVAVRENVPVVMAASVTTGMEQAHKDTFTAFIEAALNNGELNAIDAAMAEDHQTHEPFGDFSREEFKLIVAGFRAIVPDLHVEIDGLVAEGDWLAARLIYTGTFSNSIPTGSMTLEATNAPIRFIINVMVHFNADGVGIEDYKEYNRLSWLQQGGLLENN